jgi:hypothetical protein
MLTEDTAMDHPCERCVLLGDGAGATLAAARINDVRVEQEDRRVLERARDAARDHRVPLRIARARVDDHDAAIELVAIDPVRNADRGEVARIRLVQVIDRIAGGTQPEVGLEMLGAKLRAAWA